MRITIFQSASLKIKNAWRHRSMRWVYLTMAAYSFMLALGFMRVEGNAWAGWLVAMSGWFVAWWHKSEHL